ncbi:MAG: type II toxin-antitoxin system YafQ family toxin [Candidatus Daviesbacteria bacterium]|nr:type II toxin-antitoxin system YafQ family toxin [Candidatus Daviesbacteria bacterium]
MNIKYIGKFQKRFNLRIKPKPNLIRKFQDRVEIFSKDPQDIVLKDHQLRGEKNELRAFSITGDIRVIYFVKGEDAYFIDIGSHNQVY